MALLAYWQWENYTEDSGEPAQYHFSSKQKRLHSKLAEGDILWLITNRPCGKDRDYVLIARLVVESKAMNGPDYKYGPYRINANRDKSIYFDRNGPDASALLFDVKFRSGNSMSARDKVGQALQTMRELTDTDNLHSNGGRTKTHRNWSSLSP